VPETRRRRREQIPLLIEAATDLVASRGVARQFNFHLRGHPFEVFEVNLGPIQLWIHESYYSAERKQLDVWDRPRGKVLNVHYLEKDGSLPEFAVVSFRRGDWEGRLLSRSDVPLIPEPGPASTFEATPVGFELAAWHPPETEIDSTQRALHSRIVRRVSRLAGSIDRIRNTHPALSEEFVEY
jgi:hypothetical protein